MLRPRNVFQNLPRDHRQLCHVDRDNECLVARHPLRRHSPLWLILKIDVGECLPGSILHDEAFGLLIDGPGRWETAGGGHLYKFANHAFWGHSWRRAGIACPAPSDVGACLLGGTAHNREPFWGVTMRTVLSPVMIGDRWRVEITWANGYTRYFGQFASEVEAATWIARHPRLTEEVTKIPKRSNPPKRRKGRATKDDRGASPE
jgi:hypothetical protein